MAVITEKDSIRLTFLRIIAQDGVKNEIIPINAVTMKQRRNDLLSQNYEFYIILA